MKIITLCIFFALASTAHAAFDTITIGGKVIATGDRSSKLREVAGRAGSVTDIRNQLGGKIGETWEYTISGKLVSFDIYSGEIAAIND